VLYARTKDRHTGNGDGGGGAAADDDDDDDDDDDATLKSWS